jgi:hypothetical protein
LTAIWFKLSPREDDSMSDVKKCKEHGAEFKAKPGRGALGSVKRLHEPGQRSGVHPAAAVPWKKEIPARAATVFGVKRGPEPAALGILPAPAMPGGGGRLNLQAPAGIYCFWSQA